LDIVTWQIEQHYQVWWKNGVKWPIIPKIDQVLLIINTQLFTAVRKNMKRKKSESKRAEKKERK